AAVLGAAIGKRAQQLDPMALEERDHAVVQELGRRDRRLPVIEFGEPNLSIGVDEGLLVDAPDPLQVADVERILGAAIARMFALELAMRLFLGLGLLQRHQLRLGQHQRVLGALGLKALSRFFMVSRSWRCQTQRTPAGETVIARFLSSLAMRTWPKAGCSIASATIASS